MADQFSVITGATGLVGSHIAEQLIAQGLRVRALVRPSSEVAFLQALGVEIVPCAVDQPRALAEGMHGASTLYHCAARVGDWGRWQVFRTEIIDLTRQVMEAARAAGVARAVHVSTVSVYGYRPHIPPEGLSEDRPLGQGLSLWNYYGRAKIQAEHAARRAFPSVTIVRPTWIIGPRDRHVLPRLIQALRGGWVSIIGTGDNLLNMVHARDVADGAIRAAERPQARGQAYHLCTPGEITQRLFLNTLADAAGAPRVTRCVPFRWAYWGGFFAEIVARVGRWNRAPYINRHSVCLIGRTAGYRVDRAQHDLGWQPRVPVQEGLRETLAWLKAHDGSWLSGLPPRYQEKMVKMGKML